MNAMTILMAAFSILGAIDRILGNRFGLGKEFEKGFMLMGNLALSMIGMIAISPVLAGWMQPLFAFLYTALHIEPSIVPAMLFANDMGGASLACAVAQNAPVGMFNALVVSSMMGCTVSFTIPYALGAVGKQQHRPLLLGLLCGIVTIPFGCLTAGLMKGLPIGALAANLLPPAVFSAAIAIGLLRCPDLCVKIFSAVGTAIRVLITIGLALAILRFLTGIELLEGMGTLEEGASICLNAAAVMTGAFPLLHVLSRLLARPLRALGGRLGVNETGMMGFVATLANSITTFETMKEMNARGVMLNAAFAVAAAFTFADHLAFTAAFEPSFIACVIAGKLTAGLLSLLAAGMLWKRCET